MSARAIARKHDRDSARIARFRMHPTPAILNGPDRWTEPIAKAMGTVVLTGATGAVGGAAAGVLLTGGHKLVLLGRDVTLLYATRDTVRSNAVVLVDLLQEKPKS